MKPVIELVGGARPNFMKIGPIYNKILERGRMMPRFVYTRQHTIPEMSDSLFGMLGLGKPEVELKLGSCKPGVPTIAAMLKAYYDYLQVCTRPDMICSVGDTDSALISAVVAKRVGIPLCHIEAGLRSKAEFEPEEMNRMMIDTVADLLCCPTEECLDNVMAESVRGAATCVGNVMIDALVRIRESLNWEKIKPVRCDVLVTMHRPINTDSREVLCHLLDQLTTLHNSGFKVYFPLHPRTQQKMREFGIPRKPYMGRLLLFDEFLKTVEQAKVVVTDSGGVQADGAYFGVPVLLMRKTTGWNNLMPKFVKSIAHTKLLDEFDKVIRKEKPSKLNFHGWNGDAAGFIEDAIYGYVGESDNAY